MPSDAEVAQADDRGRKRALDDAEASDGEESDESEGSSSTRSSSSVDSQWEEAEDSPRLLKECPSCHVDLARAACSIDWSSVPGHLGDPCDDCCCGACGSRKEENKHGELRCRGGC